MSKKSKVKVLATLVLSLLTTALFTGSAQATPSYIEGTDVAAVMFNPTQVSSISLQMKPEDTDLLKYPNVSWDNEGPWLPAKMTATIAGVRYGSYDVGVHLKGAWGSWRDLTGKAGFKIKMDAFVPKQTLLGVVKLTLNNMVQDPSYIHEAMTYKLMRDLNIPAPRTGYADVFLNGTNYGLHLNVETIDKRLLSRWGINSKHLYKAGIPAFPDFWLDNESNFKIESGSQTDLSDMKAFIGANQYNSDAWWNAVSPLADMKEITLEWAAELYTGHWDGYTLNKNNYYVNFDDKGRATILPWGTDQTWGSGYNYFAFNGMMANKCMASSNCNELYLQSLATIASTAAKSDLATFGNAVSYAITDAISRDPFGNLAYAQSTQQAAVGQAAAQLESLKSMVVPWDTTIKSIVINNRYYSASGTIYLPPKTSAVSVQVLATQPQATAPSFSAKLVNGPNPKQASVTSADGYHRNNIQLNLYVLTQRALKSSVVFNNQSILTSKAGTSSLSAITQKLLKSKNVEVTFTLPKTNTKYLNDSRCNEILKKIQAQGIQPAKLIKVYTNLNPAQVSVAVQYQN